MRQIRKITSLILTFCFLFSSLEKARAEDIIASNLNQPSYEEILPEEKESDPSGEPVLEPTPSPEPETEAVSTEEIQFGAIETPADEIPADILPLVLDMEHFNDFSKEDQDKLWAYLTRFGPQASEEDILASRKKWQPIKPIVHLRWKHWTSVHRILPFQTVQKKSF